MAKKTDVGTVCRVDGMDYELHPVNGKKFSLAELQKAVGGYIELVRLPPGNGHRIMYANEDGIGLGLYPNRRASLIAGQKILGDVIIVRKEEAK